MNTKQVIRLSLLSSLLMILNGCGDGSSNIQKERPLAQNEQEVNNEDTKKAPVITLKGDSQVDIIQGTSYNELGATAVDSEGKNLEVTQSGKVDVNVPGSYTIVYSTTDANGNTSSIVRTVQVTVNVTV